MLADEGIALVQTGTLDRGIHLPGEWLSSLVSFIGEALPGWRDDPVRPPQSGETSLTAQLCARLNSISRHTPGWDFLQFKREEPDEADARRSIDLVIAPSGSIIWIEGREYTEYRALLPIECKRLPTPPGINRDKREYLYSCFNSTGGVQRFKAGHHGAGHTHAAMIGYLQDGDVDFWRAQLDAWIEGLVSEAALGWTTADKLALVRHDAVLRIAQLRSSNPRRSGLSAIRIDHLWIEM